MKKKILSLIGILTLIFTFGLSNVYALEDWNFEYRSSNGTSEDSIWDLYVNTGMDTLIVSASPTINVNEDASLVSEVLDWAGGWHGGPTANGPGGYSQNPGGAIEMGDGWFVNMGGDQGPDGANWDAGMSAHIATYTFDIATTLVFPYIYDFGDEYFSMTVNGETWCWSDVDTGDRMTSPGELWNKDGSTAWGMTSVPVPGAIWLLGSAMVSLLGIKRKMKNN